MTVLMSESFIQTKQVTTVFMNVYWIVDSLDSFNNVDSFNNETLLCSTETQNTSAVALIGCLHMT